MQDEFLQLLNSFSILIKTIHDFCFSIVLICIITQIYTHTHTWKLGESYKHYRENTVRLQMIGAVSKVNKKFISHLTLAKRTPSAAATVQVSHALPSVRFSCLLRGRGISFQDGAAAGKGFLCAPF